VYLMISQYLAPLDEVDKAVPDHQAFLDGLQDRGLMISAGRQDPPVGGVVLLAVDTEAQAHELMAGDPYVQRKLAEYRAIGWRPSRGVLAGHQSAGQQSD
jgi:uncharacterized protein YciI